MKKLIFLLCLIPLSNFAQKRQKLEAFLPITLEMLQTEKLDSVFMFKDDSLGYVIRLKSYPRPIQVDTIAERQYIVCEFEVTSIVRANVAKEAKRRKDEAAKRQKEAEGDAKKEQERANRLDELKPNKSKPNIQGSVRDVLAPKKKIFKRIFKKGTT